MSWSLDWFAAGTLARAGSYIRRVGWTDRWLVYSRGLWWFVTATDSHVVANTEFTETEFLARDWTTEGFAANPCGATPGYNSTAPIYGSYGGPIFTPPPVPGFPDP